MLTSIVYIQGRIQDFKLGGGAHLKKLRRAEGGAKIFEVFRVKNHDFTPKNHIFSNFRGVARNFWDISCEKSRFYAKKIIFFPILGGARAGYAPPPPPWIRPWYNLTLYLQIDLYLAINSTASFNYDINVIKRFAFDNVAYCRCQLYALNIRDINEIAEVTKIKI